MAVLQAARAKTLGLPDGRAKGWGLNRAIFYAAAKRGFKHAAAQPHHGRGLGEGKPVRKGKQVYFLGNEMAYTAKKSNRTFFTIGDELQTEADFKRQIESRFGNRYATAWKESLAIVHKYPKEVLLSQNHFFNQVYRPRRDELASKWTETTGG